jgi:hypothetical protein
LEKYTFKNKYKIILIYFYLAVQQTIYGLQMYSQQLIINSIIQSSIGKKYD